MNSYLLADSCPAGPPLITTEREEVLLGIPPRNLTFSILNLDGAEIPRECPLLLEIKCAFPLGEGKGCFPSASVCVAPPSHLVEQMPKPVTIAPPQPGRGGRYVGVHGVVTQRGHALSGLRKSPVRIEMPHSSMPQARHISAETTGRHIVQEESPAVSQAPAPPCPLLMSCCRRVIRGLSSCPAISSHSRTSLLT